MIEPKKVMYTATHNDISYQFECWEGTTLGQAWNTLKGLYLPGSVVTIEDNYGHSKRFIRGLI